MTTPLEIIDHGPVRELQLARPPKLTAAGFTGRGEGIAAMAMALLSVG